METVWIHRLACALYKGRGGTLLTYGRPQRCAYLFPPDEEMNALKVGVLGAGIAGLAAAGRLKARGHEVTVFDKGRGPGGRASSRRRGLFHFDHGAQYFTARQEEFSAAVGGWLAAGVVAPWDGHIVSLVGGVTSPLKSETRRYVGQPQMSGLAKHLARELDVRCGVLVDELTRVDGLWMPEEGGEILGAFDRLIVAMPPAQAAQLLEADSPLGGVARSVEMRPCWCVMLGLEARLEVPFDGAFCNESALSWISSDNSKPSRPQTEAWVLHASPEWTEEHLHEEREQVIKALTAEFEEVTGVVLPPVSHRDAHRWGLAQPASEEPVQALCDLERGLALACGAYVGGRVEGAYMSGLAAAAGIG